MKRNTSKGPTNYRSFGHQLTFNHSHPSCHLILIATSGCKTLAYESCHWVSLSCQFDAPSLVCSTNPHKFVAELMGRLIPRKCFYSPAQKTVEQNPLECPEMSCLFCVNLTWLCQSVWQLVIWRWFSPPLSSLFMNFSFAFFRSLRSIMVAGVWCPWKAARQEAHAGTSVWHFIFLCLPFFLGFFFFFFLFRSHSLITFVSCRRNIVKMA